MKWTSLIALALGLAMAVSLALANNLAAIGRTMAVAGWGVLAVVAAHFPGTILAAQGWRTVIEEPFRPRLRRLFQFRWIKEAVNALLPVAQVGGEFARARLLIREGASLQGAAASCTVDAAAGVTSLFAYTLLGLCFYMLFPHDAGAADIAGKGVVMGGAVAFAVALAPRLGALRLAEAGLKRLSAGRAFAALGDVGGLHEAVLALYRQPARLWTCGGWHLAAWAAGTLETYVGLSVLGLHPTLAQAFIIDSLGAGVRAAGFAVPGALGVQEGGYILVCGLFGIPPDKALAFSFMRRIRELALGVPGLAAWARLEGWRPFRVKAA